MFTFWKIFINYFILIPKLFNSQVLELKNTTVLFPVKTRGVIYLGVISFLVFNTFLGFLIGGMMYNNNYKPPANKQPSIIVSQGVGSDNPSNNGIAMFKDYINMIQTTLLKIDPFLKDVLSARPQYLLSNDIVLAGGETIASPRAFLFPLFLGLGYSFATLFIIIDCLKMMIIGKFKIKKALTRYLFGLFFLSTCHYFLSITIEISNLIVNDLFQAQNSNMSAIGQFAYNYLESVKNSVTASSAGNPIADWFKNFADAINPGVVFKDYMFTLKELAPLIFMVILLLANAFVLLVNWVVLYFLAGIAPLCLSFLILDWNHSIPRNFLNQWVQNVVQLPIFVMVYATTVNLVFRGGLSVGSPTKLALFFGFLMVSLNANSHFGSIFSGFVGYAGSTGSSMFNGLMSAAGGAAGAVGGVVASQVPRAKALGGAAMGMTAAAAGNFGSAAIGGTPVGIGGRLGRSVNSFAQGTIGNQQESYVSNRLGRMAGSIGLGSGANVAAGARTTINAGKAVGSYANQTATKIKQGIQDLKTNPDKTPVINPLR